MLEIHYDNPAGIEGRKDSSGLRFFYTSYIREYDAGILNVGEASLPFMVIPPKQESWLIESYCPKECTQDNLKSTNLPEKGIKVFAALLHTHLQGSSIWTKHVRNGVELPEIARDDNYDFNFQDIQILKEEVHIKPGDDLINYCKYQTMDRDRFVEGGPGTSQEMCVDIMFYYPRMLNGSNACTSIQYKPVHDFIGKYFPAFKNKLVTLHWNPLVAINFTWTEEMVSYLRREYDEAKTFTPTCRHQWGSGPPYNTVAIPKITKPLPQQESKCRDKIQDVNGTSSVEPASFSLLLSLFIVLLLALIS